MKQHRRRRHLRPRPTRSQVRQQIGRIHKAMQLFQVEWLLEAGKPQPDSTRLLLLHNTIVAMRDEVIDLELCA